MTDTTQTKIRLAYEETASALEAFHKLKDPVTIRQLADIRMTLCAVTSKLVGVEAELAAAGEGQKVCLQPGEEK